MRVQGITAGILSIPAFLLMAAGAADNPKVPLGLPSFSWPRDNPYSADESISCASCHDPQHGFGDGASVSTGIKSQKGGRNAPTIINRAYAMAQFWDGRAASLEDQAKGPMANPIEMGNTHDAIAKRLQDIPGYRPLFAKAFGSGEINIDRTAQAIACFERTVLSGNAPYDRYKHGNKAAMSASQVRGMSVFFDKAKCDRCHEGANFTLNMYANLGVGSDKLDPDVGRFAVTKDPRDWGLFKTPTLREIEHSAPYMHDGSVATLEEVVEFYDKGGKPNRNLDPNLRPLHLNPQEKADLVAFLKALSGEGWQHATSPASFPQ